MDYKEAKKRLLAAQKLLLEPSTSFEKFSSIRQLLYGVHPHLDELLHIADAQVGQIEKIVGGDFFSLSLDQLPDTTEEEKKRKNLIILFWNTWQQLKSEVARVQTELDAAHNAADKTGKGSHLARIFNFAKGPFGIVTIAAVAIVVTAQATSSQVLIHNDGCATLLPSSSVNISLPGLSFPKDPIPSGETGSATLPRLSYTIDGTKPGTLTASALKVTMSIQLGNIKDVTFDDVSLLGKKTVVKMGDKKVHNLNIMCK